ncbi:MAG: exo-beta-N-acetylmuramidase NamZ domain-containing protein [Ignavibacteriales bacterium]
MRRALALLLTTAVMLLSLGAPANAAPAFKLGNEVLYSRYHHLIEGKRVGLITNQSGVDSRGRSTIDVLAGDPSLELLALYGPEHGIDGKATAGTAVESYTHPTLNIPVYSLFGATRMPTEAMLKDIDVLLYDVQDIGARTYTYISTLNYAMKAARQYGKPVIVLDRPNPLGGETVEGPVLEDAFETFVGVDNLPMAHGMTVGELARFFNRDIAADLTVVPMEGYTRNMIYQDTGLPWVATSPNIPDIDSVFGYMATGLGEGTGIHQSGQFKWIGGKGIDANRLAGLLEAANLPGVTFIPETIGSDGGVRLRITDYRKFNPARTGIYALAYARRLNDFTVPRSGATPASVVMFDKVMGTNRVGQWLEQRLAPQEMESRYAAELAAFRQQRQQYLIYGYLGKPGQIGVLVDNVPVFFDSPPYIDGNNRTMVPLRTIAEALGATVQWDPAARLVTIIEGDLTVNMTIGSPTARVNGIRKAMDTVPVLQQDRTMVPLRYVGELLGASVHWDEGSRTVTVTQWP